MPSHVAQIIESAVSSEWNDIIGSLGGNFFHSRENAAYVAWLGECKPLFVRILDNEGKLAAAAVVYDRGSSVWPLSRFCRTAEMQSLPAWSHLTPARAAEAMAALEVMLRLRGIYKVASASYNSPLAADVLGPLGYELQPREEFTIDLTLPEERLWQNLSQRKRRGIRKAQKNGVEHRVLSDPAAAADAVCHCYGQSMRRRDIEVSKPARRRDAIRDFLQQSGAGFVVGTFAGDDLLGAALFGRFRQRAHYLISGSTEKGNENHATDYMLWSVALELKSQGVMELDLGGARDGEAGLRVFKSEFGGKCQAAPSGSKCISPVGGAIAGAAEFARRILRRDKSRMPAADSSGSGVDRFHS